ncbi:MAG: DUF763 domain-containing protein [Bacteroidota bacterium]
MQRSGTADMALWGGRIPPYLFQRMKALSLPMVEALILQHGRAGVLQRLSDPFWFQSFGAVIGMDWNSSGVTTAVMRALSEALNPHANELGLYVCGGKGKDSLQTPTQLLRIGDATGLDGHKLARASKLSAKVDNTALQDGFQLYLHSFVLSVEGEWTVIQQGMQGKEGLARRYHWHSAGLESFVEEPHAAIMGTNQGLILNLTAKEASATRDGIMEIAQASPEAILKEVPKLELPSYCDLKAEDVDLKRLGGVLRLAQETEATQFEDVLLLKGLGPRTMQAMTLVSEVLHGTPGRFRDPARFAFAHGGKSSKPFPVPTRIYDETITHLKEAVEQAKIGDQDKLKAIGKLTKLSQQAEAGFPDFEAKMEQERRESERYGGRKPETHPPKDQQLRLF